MDYIGQWYTPPRMVVGVSGMVGNDLIPTLEGMLGDMSGNGKDRPAPAAVVLTFTNFMNNTASDKLVKSLQAGEDISESGAA